MAAAAAAMAAARHVFQVFQMAEHRYNRIVDLRGGRSEPTVTFLIEEFRDQLFAGFRAGDPDGVLEALREVQERHSAYIVGRRRLGAKARTLDMACVRLCYEGMLAVERGRRRRCLRCVCV